MVILPLLMSIGTGLWVFSAASVGFLFGVFLQKGQLCGSSAFSEVIVLRDNQKLWGVWLVIATGMALFALASTFGWIKLSPKPLMWGSYVVGGIVFGAGTVLAGGCISGCLYKAGEGNLNSMVALLGIGMGASMVEYGPLQGLSGYLMKATLIKNATGGPVTLSSLTGISYNLLAIFMVSITLVYGLFRYQRKIKEDAAKGIQKKPDSSEILPQRIIARRWRPWQSGIAIGVLGLLAWFSSVQTGRNYPLGVTHGVLFLHTLATADDFQGIYKAEVKAPNPTTQAQPAQAVPKRKVGWWLVLLVTSLVFGSWVSAKTTGDAKLLPKPPGQVITAVFGGLLVGIGAALAGGCVVGNIMSGWALMSVGCILFGVFTILSNWAMAWFYLLGGWE
jgi:hypothetical protein